MARTVSEGSDTVRGLRHSAATSRLDRPCRRVEKRRICAWTMARADWHGACCGWTRMTRARVELLLLLVGVFGCGIAQRTVEEAKSEGSGGGSGGALAMGG